MNLRLKLQCEFFNVLVCLRVREGPPYGALRGLADFRFFVAQAEDIPGVHTRLPNNSLLPVLGPITVIARGDYIYGWQEDYVIHLIYDSEGHLIVVNIQTGNITPMTPQLAEQARPLVELNPANTAVSLQSRNYTVQNRGGHN